MSTHIRNFPSVNFTARRILGLLFVLTCLIAPGCSDEKEAAAKLHLEAEVAEKLQLDGNARLTGEQMLRVADFYYEKGEREDYEEAEKWYSAAEKAGGKLTGAQMLRLADLYYHCCEREWHPGLYRIQKREAQKPLKKYLKAVNAGAKLNGRQMRDIAELYDYCDNHRKAEEWKSEAKASYANAAKDALGCAKIAYACGNQQEAAKWCLKAANLYYESGNRQDAAELYSEAEKLGAKLDYNARSLIEAVEMENIPLR